jgi:hypothetical protein
MKSVKSLVISALLVFCYFVSPAQKHDFTAVTGSGNTAQAALVFDNQPGTAWVISARDLKNDQYLMLALQTPGDVNELIIEAQGISAGQLQNLLSVYITYDPINPGNPVAYTIVGDKKFVLQFAPKYGAHLKLLFKGGMLQTIFRNGFFENNPSKSLDWNKTYPRWNSPEHKEVAHRAALESIVLLENKDEILPLTKTTKTIAVIGPGADDLQPGDYTPKLQAGQLKSVLFGIKTIADKSTKINYVKGCEFFPPEGTSIEVAVKAAIESDVVVLVQGDYSTSESTHGIPKTSGEANDYASMVLSGNQQKFWKPYAKPENTGSPR